MNALATVNLRNWTSWDDTVGVAPFTAARYTGQESKTERQEIATGRYILLTNFMMLELILMRFEEVDRPGGGNTARGSSGVG